MIILNLILMTDKQLYSLCKKYGRRVLEARRRFLGLLPEVNRREMAARGRGQSWLNKRGFSCVYEFAARLGGVTREQVDRVLCLEKRFVEVPVLHEALVRGEVSASKLARVAGVVNISNAGDVLGLAKNLSYAALNIKVQEIKMENGLLEPEKRAESVCAHALEELGVGAEVAEKLMELKRKGLDVNSILSELLARREREMAEEERRLEERIVGKGKPEVKIPAEVMTQAEGGLAKERRPVVDGAGGRSRYVTRAVKRLVIAKFGDKCAVSGCGRVAVEWHHLRPFAWGGGQSPGNLQPLCRGHHQLEHSGTGRGW